MRTTVRPAATAGVDYTAAVRHADLRRRADAARPSPSWSTATGSASRTRPSSSTSASPTTAPPRRRPGVSGPSSTTSRTSASTAARPSRRGTRARTTMTFTVTLSAASDAPVTVNYATADGTRHGRQRLPGHVGHADLRPRRDEQDHHRAGQRRPARRIRRVLLRQPRPPRPTRPSPTAGLRAPSRTTSRAISISDVSRSRRGTAARRLITFTVTLSAAYDQAVTVRYATPGRHGHDADNDYVATSGTLTFAPGETTKTITVSIKGDKKREADESFYVVLSDASSNALLIRTTTAGARSSTTTDRGRRDWPTGAACRTTVERCRLAHRRGSQVRRVRTPRASSADAAAPAAVEFHYTQTDSFVALLHAARRVAAGEHLPGQQAAGRPGRGGGLSMLVRTFDRPMGLAVDAGGWRSAPATRSGSPQRPGHRPAGRAGRAARRLLPAALQPRHRRHRRPRDGLGRRRAVGRQHPLLVPVHAAPRLQLRAALAAAVRHRPGRRGPLPPQRPGRGRRPAPVRHRPGRDRRAGRLAGGQGDAAAA